MIDQLALIVVGFVPGYILGALCVMPLLLLAWKERGE